MLKPDGTYVRVTAPDASPHRSQVELLALAANRTNGAPTAGTLPSSFDAIPAATSGNGEPPRDGAKRKKKKRAAGQA
jgi:hypothetical protein